MHNTMSVQQPLPTDTQAGAHHQPLPDTTPTFSSSPSSYHNGELTRHHRFTYFELDVAGRSDQDAYVAYIVGVGRYGLGVVSAVREEI